MNELTLPPAAELLPAAAADQNPAAVYLASLAPTGRAAMLSKLRRVAQLLGAEDPLAVPWAAIRYQHLAAIRARLIDAGLAPATVNATLAAVRGVAHEAYRLGQMTSDDYQRLCEVPPVRGQRLLAGRALTHGEIAALMDACLADDSPAGARDAAILALAYAAGLRRSEIVGLDLADYDPSTGRLVVRGGKGKKDRELWASNGAAEALGDWLAVRGSEPGPLFWAVNKGGRLVPGRLTPAAVRDAMRKRAAQAGVKEFSPHDLRRTFISDLLDAGADIATVAGLAGHASVQTTARYDRRGDEAKRKAVQLLHLPYRGRAAAAGPTIRAH